MSKDSWNAKLKELLNIAQGEIKKTTVIGKKMITASKTNTNLHQAYEEMGMLVVSEIEKGNLKWENQRVYELLELIKHYCQEIESIEEEMNKIKFPSGPEDVSQKNRDKNAL